MDFQNNTLSVTYHQGSRTVLNPKWHDRNIICPNSKIYYILDGELCVETKEEKLIARAGYAILIPAGVKHSYYLTEHGYAEKYWFHFDLRSGQSNFLELLSIPKMRYIGKTAELFELFDKIVMSKNKSPYERLSLAANIITLMGIYIGSSDYKETRAINNDETDKVILYIKKNYFESFTLESLAERASLSPNYFAKKFKDRVGLSPLKYINALRIERAKFLLEHTDNPVNTIMEEVGFWDAAHFSKLFKAATGYSPSKFREALAKKS